MRYMMIVQAAPAGDAGAAAAGRLTAAMAGYRAQLAQAGVLLDAAELAPSAQGWRIDFRGGQRLVADGPYADGRAQIAGYALIQVRDRAEAMEWARRFPAPAGDHADAVLEVRPLCEPQATDEP